MGKACPATQNTGVQGRQARTAMCQPQIMQIQAQARGLNAVQRRDAQDVEALADDDGGGLAEQQAAALLLAAHNLTLLQGVQRGKAHD